MTNVAIRDIAKYAGVSPATVSRVLNGSKPVADNLRQRVEDAVTKLDYRPSRVARNLRRSRTESIGFVLDSIQNPFFPTLIEQVTEVAERHNLAVNITISHDPLKAARELFQAPLVDGVLLVGGASEADMPEHAEKFERMPIVAIDRAIDGLNFPRFSATNEKGAFEVVSHLLECVSVIGPKLAPRSFLHIRGPKNLSITDHRRVGTEKALSDSNVSEDVFVTEHGDFTSQSGFDVVSTYLKNSDLSLRLPHPRLIFADNDLMAIGAIKAAEMAGLTIGRDVMIAGFDGLELCTWVHPSLTSYRQPIREITNAAVEYLITMIDNSAPQSPNRDFEFPGELIVRSSTGGIQ